MAVYKYLPQQFAHSFVNRGAVLFRALSYFHDLESAVVAVVCGGGPVNASVRHRNPHATSR